MQGIQGKKLINPKSIDFEKIDLTACKLKINKLIM